MKRAQLEKMFGIAGQPWPTVAPDPEDTGDGNGGGGSNEDDGEDLALGEAGQKALSEERAQRKALSTELAQLKAQLAQMKNLVSPEVYAQAQAQATALQQQIADQKQSSEAERQRIETKANQRVTQAEARAQKAENDRVALLAKTAAQSLFIATEGRDGGDENGLTYFDAWFAFHGKHHIRVNPTTGKAFVVDSDGDPIKDGEQNIDLVKWLNEQADKSAVIGSFFKPKGGSGGGGLQGARGVRSAQGLTPEQLRKLTPSQKMEAHREASRR